MGHYHWTLLFLPPSPEEYLSPLALGRAHFVRAQLLETWEVMIGSEGAVSSGILLSCRTLAFGYDQNFLGGWTECNNNIDTLKIKTKNPQNSTNQFPETK